MGNTQLVRDGIAIEDLEKEYKKRVLTVEEVGDGFESILKLDQNGGCLVVYPDCPPFLVPDNCNQLTLMAMILFGKMFGNPMNFSTFSSKHVLFGTILIFGLFCVALNMIF